MAVHVRAAFIIFCLAAASMVRAGDMCPAPPKYRAPIASDIAADDHRIQIDSDDAVLDADGHAVLTGRVKVRQDARSVTSDSVNYDNKTGRISVKGAVDFEDPKLRVRSDAGTYDISGAANFDKANFQLMDRNGRGFARDIDVLPDGKLALASVRYTTCPVGNEDWMLQASSIDLDTAGQEGSAHNVLMRFKSVPIFYTPYISFPLGDERKSGVLFPSFGHSGTNGYQFEVPSMIEECFDQILATAAAIKDPFEQAFFAMVHLPYLQPFEDVNKRVSRLAANIPLVRGNLCPLSFVDVPERAYVDGLLAVYELNLVELLRDVFVWAYERSSQRYAAILQSTGEPDRFRLRFRTELTEVVGDIVRRLAPPTAEEVTKVAADHVPSEHLDDFVRMAVKELQDLHEGNYARFRLRPSEYRSWREAQARG